MNISKNITSIFIVPTLKVSRDELKINGYIMGYIKDLNHSLNYDDNYVVFLLFEPKDLDVFKEFLNSQYENEFSLIEDYSHNENQHILVYKLDEKYKKDFDLIFQSKYSKTSKKFQELFPKTVIINNKVTESLQQLIFKKDIKLLKYWENTLSTNDISKHGLEIWTEFNIDNEIIDLEE